MIELEIIKINTLDEAREEIEKIGADKGAIPYIVPKAVHMTIKIKDVRSICANIIKQEMLARGGDAAVHRGALDHSVEYTDVLLMGTISQLRSLVRKLRVQGFGLEKIAQEIRDRIG
jgi:dihydropteroate synthase